MVFCSHFDLEKKEKENKLEIILSTVYIMEYQEKYCYIYDLFIFMSFLIFCLIIQCLLEITCFIDR